MADEPLVLVGQPTGVCLKHGQLKRVCDYCELEAKVADLRAQLEQAQSAIAAIRIAKIESLSSDGLSAFAHALAVAGFHNHAMLLGDCSHAWKADKATIARQREWIEKAGHRPGCAITKCKAYPGCSGGQYSPVHSARHFAFEHVFIPSPCDCGWAEQVGG